MINPDTQQVFLLSDFFHQLGNTIGEYIQENKSTLSDTERNALFDKQIELLRLSGEINMWGVALVFEDVQETISQLENITSEVKKTIRKVLAVQKAIDIAASIVELGTAIIAKDPKLIGEKILAAGKTIGTNGKTGE